VIFDAAGQLNCCAAMLIDMLINKAHAYNMSNNKNNIGMLISIAALASTMACAMLINSFISMSF